MKLMDKYYNKVYKQTEKITRRLFQKDVIGSLALRYKIKQNLEKITCKDVEEITNEDVVKYHIGYNVAKYRTLSKILEVVETACTLKNFTIEEYENEC